MSESGCEKLESKQIQVFDRFNDLDSNLQLGSIMRGESGSSAVKLWLYIHDTQHKNKLDDKMTKSVLSPQFMFNHKSYK